MRNASVTTLSFLGLLVFGLAWGTTQPLTKIAVSTGHQPMGLIFWQMLFGVFLLGTIVVWKRIAVPVDRQHLTYYLGIAFIGTLVPNSFSFLAAAQLPAGIMAVAITTVPMFSLLIALALGNERFRVSRSLGIVLGVSAMLLIALPEASLPLPGQAFWVLIALIAPLCYGVEGNYVASKVPSALNPIAALWGASLLGCFIAGPAALASGQWVDLFRTWQAPEYALLGSSIAHAVAYSGYMWLVGFAGVVFTAQIAYVVTIGAITIAMVFLGENYSGYVWIAVALMMIGLTLVQPMGKLPEVELTD
jgi:drug/metabolite transporter (DMT)-like permease